MGKTRMFLRLMATCVLATSGLAGLGACGAQGAQQPAEAAAMPVRTLEYGHFSRMTREVTRAIRSEAEWEAFYPAHRSEEIPRVDFSQEMVLVVIQPRPTGGYSVAIDDASVRQGELVVSYTETVPSPDAVVIQVLTQPYVFAAVPLRHEPVRFVRQERIGEVP